jgi:hypothetical protein
VRETARRTAYNIMLRGSSRPSPTPLLQARSLERIRAATDEESWTRVVGAAGLPWAAEDMHGAIHPLRLVRALLTSLTRCLMCARSCSQLAHTCCVCLSQVNGSVPRVSFEERHQYYREVLALRLGEASVQLAAIREGLLLALPLLVLSLMTWREVSSAPPPVLWASGGR